MTVRPARDAKRILVVEDELIVADDIAIALEEMGYEIAGIAGSSDEALAQAELGQPDLVLMDIRLPGRMDGIETANYIRGRHGVPIVFLSANADDATIERALDASAAGYLAKPFDMRSLRTAIQLAFHHHEAELALRSEHAAERARLARENTALNELAEYFQHESMIDPLTGLFNRRQLDVVLRRELALGQREGHPVGVIMLDLDRFKLLNDSFGHVAADAALRGVADLLRARLRIYDVAFRYGGEEILIVVPGAGVDDTYALAEQLRGAIAQLIVEHEGQELTPITASFGISSFPRHAIQPEPLIRAADSALYAAKAEGRNRVSIAPAR